MSRRIPRPDRCRDCRAPILWASTVRGKRIPLDVEPDPIQGAFVLLDDLAVSVNSPDFVDGPEARYTCHLATCEEIRRGA